MRATRPPTTPRKYASERAGPRAVWLDRACPFGLGAISRCLLEKIVNTRPNSCRPDNLDTHGCKAAWRSEIDPIFYDNVRRYAIPPLPRVRVELSRLMPSA
jgi:hypothetical protein